MRKRILLIFLLLNALFICLGPGPTDAAIKLRLDQPKVRLAITPGESQSGQMSIENPTEQTLALRCYLEDWFYAAGGDGAKEFRPTATTPLSCASWISFSPAEFELQPFGRQIINYRVSLPAEVSGGHYAVLFFETIIGEGKDEQGLNVLVLGKLGSLFYVQAKGTVNKQAALKDIAIKEEKQGFTLRAKFNNTGNVDITASGSFNLIDKYGVVFARGQFNDAYTFPQDEVALRAVWDEDIEPGIYDLIITLDLGDKTLVEESEVRLGRGKSEP